RERQRHRQREKQAAAPADEEAGEAAAMAAVAAAAAGTGPAVLQVAGRYRGLCAVRSRALGLGLVSAAQLRVFPVRRGSGRADGGGVGAELEANPFYDRYRDKIQQLRRSDPAAFESRLEKRIEFRKQPVGHSKQGDFIRCVEQKVRPSLCLLTLSSIFNIEMVKDKTAEEIRQIWQQYFAAKDTVYAVIPEEKFDLIWTRAQSCPTNVAEAQCIANQVQLFYATDRKETYGLVETFNFRPNEFKYMSVIAELEQSGLGAELKCAQNQDKT
uniref:ATP synthase mitochondrial F1 complex assembly factor 1 n=1 Tax=Canis lupus dingo TaxID=286419 RepID=A0A8C0KPX0_CANLU